MSEYFGIECTIAKFDLILEVRAKMTIYVIRRSVPIIGPIGLYI